MLSLPFRSTSTSSTLQHACVRGRRRLRASFHLNPDPAAFEEKRIMAGRVELPLLWFLLLTDSELIRGTIYNTYMVRLRRFQGQWLAPVIRMTCVGRTDDSVFLSHCGCWALASVRPRPRRRQRMYEKIKPPSKRFVTLMRTIHAYIVHSKYSSVFEQYTVSHRSI